MQQLPDADICQEMCFSNNMSRAAAVIDNFRSYLFIKGISIKLLEHTALSNLEIFQTCRCPNFTLYRLHDDIYLNYI